MKTIIFSISFLFISLTFSQGNSDSLAGVWANENETDTTRIKALRLLIWNEYMYVNPDTVLVLGQKMYELAEKSNHIQFMANAKSIQGVALSFKSEFVKSNELFFEAEKMFEKIDHKMGLAAQNINLGINFKAISDYPRAVAYFLKASKIYEDIDFESGKYQCLNNLATIYMIQKQYEKALLNFEQCLKFYKNLEDVEGQMFALSNIGTVYDNLENWDEAEIYYQKAIQMALVNDNKWGVAQAYMGMGSVLSGKNQDDLALDYMKGALEINKEIGGKEDVAEVYLRMIALLNKKNRYDKAIEKGKIALLMAEEIGVKNLAYQICYQLYRSYEKKGKISDALKMHKKYIAYKEYSDSLENRDEVTRLSIQHQYTQLAAQDSVRNIEVQKTNKAELAKSETEKENQKIISYALIAVLGLALLSGGFAYNRFKYTKKQNVIIQEQKEKVDYAFDELEQKNNEILDSITYAKRIQSAILPPTKLVEKYLLNSFILYKPKDIVAGDFYWMEPLEQGVLFAAADCTGHGVPGAMVSVVCNNALNRAVREYGLVKPGEILNKTREIVIKEFDQSVYEAELESGNYLNDSTKEVVKDGMDIALCFINGNKLEYAGAHNPIWIIRNGANVIEEIKAEKQPIGKFATSNEYPTHEIELMTGDTIYIFSDGYADQFGGEDLPSGKAGGKKLKSSNFKKILIEIQDKSMEEQRAYLDNSFETWKGELEQLDDVCVIGVRV